MQINEASITIALLCSTILIGVMYLLRKWAIPYRRDIKIYAILFAICIVRMAVPIELPPMSYAGVKSVYSPLFLLMYEEISCGSFEMTIGQSVLWIWGTVACILMVCYMYKYFRSMNGLWHTSNEDEKLSRILEEIQGSNMTHRVRIMRNPYMETPISAGIIRRCIIIPQNACEQDVPFMVRHEWMHIKHGDLVIKALLNVMCCVFWFNPCVYYLRRNAGQIMEIHCDRSVTIDMSDVQKADYLKMILSVFRQSDQKEKDRNYLYLFGDMSTSNIKERFEAVEMEHNSNRRWSLSYVAVVMIVTIFVLASYLFSSRQYHAALHEFTCSRGGEALSLAQKENILENKMAAYDVDGDYINPVTKIAGMAVTGKESIDEQHRIIDVSETYRQMMFDETKRHYALEYGVANGDTTLREEVFLEYQKHARKTDRQKGTWTLGQYEKMYTLAFRNAVLKNNPEWKIGDAFDAAILDSVTREDVEADIVSNGREFCYPSTKNGYEK